MSSSDYPEYVPRNVEIWTKANAEHTGETARRAWGKDEIDWGVFEIPESQVDVLGDVAGLDVVELGCGTAYFSAWLAKRGARPVGVDPTPAQLATARELQREFGLEFPLIEGVGESVPLPDASFDLALSEYGASIWADPYRWIPEAARLLRPGGRLIFLRNSHSRRPLPAARGRGRRAAAAPPARAQPDRVARHRRGRVPAPARRADRAPERLRLQVERLVELYAPDDAETHGYYDFVTAEWARKWPAEELWVARKR